MRRIDGWRKIAAVLIRGGGGMMIICAALAAALVLGLLAAPLVAPAQQPLGETARIEFLSFVTTPFLDEAFRQGLRELGYVEGKNIAIEYRSAEGRMSGCLGSPPSSFV